jgi:hypothetical protein
MSDTVDLSTGLKIGHLWTKSNQSETPEGLICKVNNVLKPSRRSKAPNAVATDQTILGPFREDFTLIAFNNNGSF